MVQKEIDDLEKPLFNQRSIRNGLVCLILATAWIWMVMSIFNSDWSVLEARLAKAGEQFAALSERVQYTAQASVTETPMPDTKWHLSGDVDEEFREREIPEEVQRVMQKPEEHFPAEEPYIRSDKESNDLPYYTQEELPLAKTWAVNKTEVNWVLGTPTNYSHTEIDHEGNPFMVAYAEWEIGVRGQMGSFKLLRSDRPGYSKVTWTNKYGMTETRELPFEGFILIRSDGNPDAYLYQSSDGWIHFVKPAYGAHPIWQIQFEFGGPTMQEVSWETTQDVPYGIIKMDDGLWNLYRSWTNPLQCPDDNYLGESCNSLR